MDLASDAEMRSERRYVVVTPVRDEVEHVGRTIGSVLAQSLPPTMWIVVDDGSKDGTGELLDRAAKACSFMRVVHRQDRGFRANGGGVMEAFRAGYDALGDRPWDYLVKLDADLSFAADYFERCLDEFERHPTLGIGGGTICRESDTGLAVESAGDPPFHVRGATKIYRRACWESIGPLVPAAGWDTIDEIKANLLGWHTRSFATLPLVQHKPTGSADGHWSNAYKNGRANYLAGYHPAFMIAKCLRRAVRRPLVLGAVAHLCGYCSGYIHGSPRPAGPDVVRYLRQQQIRRLMLRPSIYG